MKRVDLHNRAHADKFGSGKHGFQGGNPAGGVLPTIPGAEWFNHIQEEVCSVIEGAGITLNPKKYNQLAEAVKKIYANGVVNNLTSGDEDKVLSAAMGRKLNEEKVSKTGDEEIGGAKTFTSLLTAGRAEHWGKIRMPVQSGGHWFLEANPQSNLADGATLKFNIKYEQESGQVRYIHFPDLGNNNHMVAYQDWVTTQINAATGAVNDKIANAAPPGTIVAYSGTTAPPGWLKCNGANVSRTTYAALFAVIGTTHGAGDGRTTFTLPDIRNEFIRGLDDGRGLDSSRALGSKQTARLPQHSHGVGFMIGDDMRFAKAGVNYNIDSGKDFYLSAGANSTTSVERYSGNGQRVETIATYGMTGDLAPSNIAELYIIKI